MLLAQAIPDHQADIFFKIIPVCRSVVFLDVRNLLQECDADPSDLLWSIDVATTVTSTLVVAQRFVSASDVARCAFQDRTLLEEVGIADGDDGLL